MSGIASRSRSVIVILLLATLAGCTAEIRQRYTFENILIGAAIGLGVGFLITVLGKVFGSSGDEPNDD